MGNYQNNMGGFGDEMSLIFKSLLRMQNDVSEIKREVNYISERVDSVEESRSTVQMPSFDEEDFEKKLEEFNLESIEKKMIELALDKYNGNRRVAAENLGISPRTLYRKISDYGLE
jgi:DNA-binding NtrC family response regulator